jgi:hypothetical protein
MRDVLVVLAVLAVLALVTAYVVTTSRILAGSGDIDRPPDDDVEDDVTVGRAA